MIGAADAVQAEFQGREIEFTAFRDLDTLHTYIDGHDPINRIEPDLLRTKLQEGKVRVYCGLDVHSANEIAYIDEWNWRLEVDVEPGENPTPGPGGNSEPRPRRTPAATAAS